MRPAGVILLAALMSPALPAQELPTVVTRPLPTGAEQTGAFLVPTSTDFALEINFPQAIADWAGRGFTPDPDRFAGDLLVDTTRGSRRMYVTALVPDAHRVLHVALSGPDGATQTIPLEFVPSVPGRALRKLTFTLDEPSAVVAAEATPERALRPSTSASQLALLRLLRLLDTLPPEEGASLARTAPALHLRRLAAAADDLGEVTVRARFVVADDVTGETGLCIEVANATRKRILLDPRSWLVRSGSRTFPVRTVDFTGPLEPAASVHACLVLGPEAATARLSEQDRLMITASVEARAGLSPVQTYDVDPLPP